MAVIFWDSKSAGSNPSVGTEDRSGGKRAVLPATSKGEVTSDMVTTSGWMWSSIIMFKICKAPFHSRLFWQASAAELKDMVLLLIFRWCISVKRCKAWGNWPLAAQALIWALHMISFGWSRWTTCILAMSNAHCHWAALQTQWIR